MVSQNDASADFFGAYDGAMVDESDLTVLDELPEADDGADVQVVDGVTVSTADPELIAEARDLLIKLGETDDMIGMLIDDREEDMTTFVDELRREWAEKERANNPPPAEEPKPVIENVLGTPAEEDAPENDEYAREIQRLKEESEALDRYIAEKEEERKQKIAEIEEREKERWEDLCKCPFCSTHSPETARRSGRGAGTTGRRNSPKLQGENLYEQLYLAFNAYSNELKPAAIARLLAARYETEFTAMNSKISAWFKGTSYAKETGIAKSDRMCSHNEAERAAVKLREALVRDFPGGAMKVATINDLVNDAVDKAAQAKIDRSL